MNTFESNPFALLTFLAAPAILTNASSIMALSTSNRFGLVLDRINRLWSEVDSGAGARGADFDVRANHLRLAERRAKLLVYALTAFYLSVGAFVAGTFVSLMGTVLYATHEQTLQQLTQVGGLCTGALGVAGLVTGCSVLFVEARMALRLLAEDSDFRMKRSLSALEAATQDPGKDQ